MKALVVGGGIGGLASAVALLEAGWEVEVLEQAPQFSEVGAGLSLWPNAVRALDRLGLGAKIREQSRLEGAAGIRDQRGRWLSRTDTATLEERFGPTAMIHRATLLDILRSGLPDTVLRPGVTVAEVGEDGSVRHSAGQSHGDVVVGADGLRSVVRSTRWPSAAAPVFAGYSAWRMVTREPVALESSAESWGSGERFGYAALPDGRVYCFAAVTTVPGGAGGTLEELRERFAEWHDPVPRLLAAVDAGDVLYHDLFRLPPLDTFVRGEVALVGDAAHAMTPDLGQGACQALEDAVALGDAAAAGDLARYDHRRRQRAQMIGGRSTRIGRVAQWESPVAVQLRNTLLRAMPQQLFLRALEPVLGADAGTSRGGRTARPGQ